MKKVSIKFKTRVSSSGKSAVVRTTVSNGSSSRTKTKTIRLK